MANLKVYLTSEEEWLVLPRCFYTLSGKHEAKRSVMMSGKECIDNIGTRLTITGKLGYIPQDDLTALTSQIRQGGFSLVEYQDLDGESKQAYFYIEPLQAGVFKYVSDVPVWVDIPITMTAQEVV